MVLKKQLNQANTGYLFVKDSRTNRSRLIISSLIVVLFLVGIASNFIFSNFKRNLEKSFYSSEYKTASYYKQQLLDLIDTNEKILNDIYLSPTVQDIIDYHNYDLLEDLEIEKSRLKEHLKTLSNNTHSAELIALSKKPCGVLQAKLNNKHLTCQDLFKDLSIYVVFNIEDFLRRINSQFKSETVTISNLRNNNPHFFEFQISKNLFFKFKKNDKQFTRSLNVMKISHYIFMTMLILLISFILYIIWKKSLRETFQVLNSFESMLKGDYKVLPLNRSDTSYEINKKINKIVSELKLTNNLKAKAQLHDLAKQVAHDIRSPLAALELVMEDIRHLPEDSRELTLHAINRIKDIANNLSKDSTQTKQDGPTSCLPSITVANVVNEKNIEYQNINGIEISFEDQTSKRNFVQFKESELARIVSNLINNAVESLKQQGRIDVTLSETENSLQLIVQDNGAGFPTEILEAPISRGNTIGKDNGQGLGLAHAKEIVETFGGTLSIANKSDGASGAIIEISIPRAAAPAWFKDEINLSDKSRTVIIDDDQSIHGLWKKLIKQKHAHMPIKDLYTTAEIKSALKDVKNDELVLIDYDLRQDKNGLDYIREFNLQNVALVTSNYDTEEVVNYCSEHGIQLIPKQIVSAINLN